jgi:hypothetical protein
MRSFSAFIGITAATLAAPLLLVGSADASTPAAAVQYGDPGWRYLETNVGGGPADFADPSFDDSSWAVGEGAFGTPGSKCDANSDVATSWSANTDLLARKTFTLPPGATDLSVGVAIDNDYTVYVNGVQVGAGSHELCASYDSVVLPVDDSLLNAGSNTLAVRAHDRGDLAYFDARINYVDGPAYQVCAPSSKGKGKAHKKAHRSGSTIPVKLRICDETGANVSSRDIVVHATMLQTVDGNHTAMVKDSGKANSPTNDFRYRSRRAGYIYNLSTKGLDAGAWQLCFTVDGEVDPTYVVELDIRS